MKLYMVSDSDGPLYVLAETFAQAVEKWRDGWNLKSSADGQDPVLGVEDEPGQVVLIAEEDELYLGN